MKKSKAVLFFAYFVLFSIFISGIVIADKHKIDEGKRNDFNARLQHISCKIDLTKKQIDLLSTVNLELSAYKDKLDADYTKLKEFAEAFNQKEFNGYLTTIFKDNLKDAAKNIREAKRDYKRTNMTKEDKKQLRENHKKLEGEFAECINNAEKLRVDNRIDYLNRWVTRWNAQIEKMKEKGYDTTEMEAVVKDATDKLSPTLEAIKNSTKDNRKILMDNARNLHLHLWARFEIARINSFFKSMENDAVVAGLQTDIEAIKAKLDEASKLAVEGKRYAPGEFETTWNAIKDAAQMLKKLNKDSKK